MNTIHGVRYIGAQKDLFRTGRADAKLSLAELSEMSDLYALGPVAGLDGEMTVLDSQPHVSQVRGGANGYIIDRTFNHGAIFLVWAQVCEWDDVHIAESVSSYQELETVVQESARQHGIDTDLPFPFLMAGTPRELLWHINVDRTGGQPITPELFRKSKQQYTLRDKPVEIFGVYSRSHGGVFMSEGLKIHIHFVSRDGAASGHIDAIVPGGLTLRLPRGGSGWSAGITAQLLAVGMIASVAITRPLFCFADFCCPALSR
jgi:acetolactate decarboxylase